jgi:hypothetical protein
MQNILLGTSERNLEEFDNEFDQIMRSSLIIGLEVFG